MGVDIFTICGRFEIDCCSKDTIAEISEVLSNA